MSRWLARGLHVNALALTLALACGGNTKSGQRVPEAVPSASAGSAMAAGSAVTTGGKTSREPAADGGAAEPTAQGGQDSEGGAARGEGGAPIDPCGGLTARCQPGEAVCDPARGKLTTCSACGQALLGGETPCVRLIASDKESNGFCVVRAGDQLECWPGWGQAQKSVVPSDVVQLLLQDDWAYNSEPIKPCLRKKSGEYSCMGSAQGLLQVAVGDSGVCTIFSDHTLYCTGSVTLPSVVVPSPIDITITDNNAYVLGAIGVATSVLPARLPTFWKGAPAQLRVDHQGAGCLVSSLGELACWLDQTEALRPSPWNGNYQKLVPTTLPRACVLDDARQVRCGDIFADAEPKQLGGDDVIDFAASASTVCTLSVAGRVNCWNGAGEPLAMPEGW